MDPAKNPFARRPRVAGTVIVVMGTAWAMAGAGTIADAWSFSLGGGPSAVATGMVWAAVAGASVTAAIVVQRRWWTRSLARTLVLIVLWTIPALIFFASLPPRESEDGFRPGAIICSSWTCLGTTSTISVGLGLAVAALGGVAVVRNRRYTTADSFSSLAGPTGHPCETVVVPIRDQLSGETSYLFLCACGRAGSARTSRSDAVNDALAHLPTKAPDVVSEEGNAGSHVGSSTRRPPSAAALILGGVAGAMIAAAGVADVIVWDPAPVGVPDRTVPDAASQASFPSVAAGSDAELRVFALEDVDIGALSQCHLHSHDGKGAYVSGCVWGAEYIFVSVALQNKGEGTMRVSRDAFRLIDVNGHALSPVDREDELDPSVAFPEDSFLSEGEFESAWLTFDGGNGDVTARSLRYADGGEILRVVFEGPHERTLIEPPDP